jgi:uncharacterized protein
MARSDTKASLAKTIQLLERQNSLLQKSSAGAALNNSLFSLVQDSGIQSPLNSFNNLAYFNVYSPITINWTLLTFMYKTHGIVQTAIDMPVLDAFRGGVELVSKEMDADNIHDVKEKLENDGILGLFGNATVWARLYGGGAVIVNDGDDMDTPLRMEKGKDFKLYAANRWELVATKRHSEYYSFYGVRVHHTRVLTIAGKEAPYLIRWTLQGWGMSEIERMIEDFNMYLRTKDVVYELLREAKIDVFKFNNFTDQLLTSAGTSMVESRIQLMNRIKSFQNAVILDKEDEFDQKQITFTGLAEVAKQNMIYIASALRMPLTKLFGLSATGFNSGEDDIENYNAMVESEVREPSKPHLRKLIDLLCIHLFGETYDFQLSFKPLRVLSTKEEEEVNTSKLNRYMSLYNAGLLTAQETMQIVQNEKLIPIESAVASGEEPIDMTPQLDEPEVGMDADDDKNDKSMKEGARNAA